MFYRTFILSLVALHCVVYQVETASVLKNGSGNKCVADRMRALANAKVPYESQSVCEIEKTFLTCISSASKPTSTLNIVQHLLSCTRLRLMKEYNFCQPDNYTCDFPQELVELPADQKFVFPEIEMINFGKIHLEGCLNLFTYMQRYSIHPCTESAISSLCMKPLIKGLGLFESSNKYFSNLSNELSCNCADIAHNLCNDPKLCPTDIFNHDLKSVDKMKNHATLFVIDQNGECVSIKRNKTSSIDKCLKMDFKAVGKCLQKRYIRYANVSFDNTKLPFERHCDIETEVYDCLRSKKSKSELDENCKNRNNFIFWVRIQSYITMKILQSSNKCTKNPYSLNIDNLLPTTFPVAFRLNLLHTIRRFGDKLTTQCNQQAFDTCYYVRSYMHEFLVHPCIEWMMFYRCIRDNLMACGETNAADFITGFLDGQMPKSINKGNQWNHNECALLNKMHNFEIKEDFTTLNEINPLKKNIDI